MQGGRVSYPSMQLSYGYGSGTVARRALLRPCRARLNRLLSESRRARGRDAYRPVPVPVPVAWVLVVWSTDVYRVRLHIRLS